jgi:hypothetical protein
MSLHCASCRLFLVDYEKKLSRREANVMAVALASKGRRLMTRVDSRDPLMGGHAFNERPNIRLEPMRPRSCASMSLRPAAQADTLARRSIEERTWTTCDL